MNQTHRSDATAPHLQPSMPENVRDPVCGMNVSSATAKWKHEYAGQTYYFCNSGCAEKFRAEPDKYLAGAEQAAPGACCGCGGGGASAR